MLIWLKVRTYQLFLPIGLNFEVILWLLVITFFIFIRRTTCLGIIRCRFENCTEWATVRFSTKGWWIIILKNFNTFSGLKLSDKIHYEQKIQFIRTCYFHVLSFLKKSWSTSSKRRILIFIHKWLKNSK